jgi:hypothetical protein
MPPSALPGTTPMTARPLRNGLTIRPGGVPRSHRARRRDLIRARLLAQPKSGVGGVRQCFIFCAALFSSQ